MFGLAVSQQWRNAVLLNPTTPTCSTHRQWLKGAGAGVEMKSDGSLCCQDMVQVII